MNKLAIFGASGHGKVVAEIALEIDAWEEIAFFDDRWPQLKLNGAFDVKGDFKDLKELSTDWDVVVAIGDNKTRLLKFNELESLGRNIVTLQHPASIVSNTVKIGMGSVIMAGAVVNADASIGEACIINSNAVVEHDCKLSSGVHISPNACVAGAVEVGKGSWIGLGASVIQTLVIGANVIVGSGAVVVKDVPASAVVVGIPAKIK